MKNYTQFLLEGFNIDSQTLIDILRSLQTGKNQQIVIDKLTKNIDSSKKNILMNIVLSNNEELLDYVLQFDLDLNHKDKDGQNVLFYAKSIKIFKKLYQLGADPTVTNIKNDNTTLIYLSSRNLFNVELYQQLINNGVNINELNSTNQSVLSNACRNKSMVELLIKNKVNLNGDDKEYIFRSLFYSFNYEEGKRKNIINIIKLLADNGMKLDETFNEKLFDSLYDREPKFTLIESIKEYFNQDAIIKLYQKFVNYYPGDMKGVSKRLIRIFESSELYQHVKNFYRSSNFEGKFADIIEEYPWFEAANKYNL